MNGPDLDGRGGARRKAGVRRRLAADRAKWEGIWLGQGEEGDDVDSELEAWLECGPTDPASHFPTKCVE